MNKIMFNALVAITMALPMGSWAGNNSGFYIGGSVGQTNVDTSDDDFYINDQNVYIDDSSSGYKILLGYNFGLIPLLDIAVEADYRDFGDFENMPSKFLEDVTAFNFYGLAGIKAGPFGFFGKAGVSYASADITAADDNIFYSDYSFSYGIGAKIQLGNIAVRTEYESFELENMHHLYMFSIGGTATF